MKFNDQTEELLLKKTINMKGVSVNLTPKKYEMLGNSFFSYDGLEEKINPKTLCNQLQSDSEFFCYYTFTIFQEGEDKFAIYEKYKTYTTSNEFDIARLQKFNKKDLFEYVSQYRDRVNFDDFDMYFAEGVQDDNELDEFM